MGNNLEREVARALIRIGAVGFAPENPVTFKAGMRSPIYIDNRKFPFHPEEWKIIISGFKDLIEENNIEAEVIAGVEAAGIPHSAALGFFLNKPSIFVRKKPKDHGTQKRVEGGDVSGKKVVLIEDLVSTGSSSLAGVEALRNEGAVVDHCIVIVTYGFEEAKKAFAEANVNLHPLTSVPIIIEEAVALQKLTKDEAEVVSEWFADPYGWAEKRRL